MSIDRPTLDEVVRHAEHYGCERVYETASAHLEPQQLGEFVVALRRLDRHFRLTPAEKVALARAPLETSLPHSQIGAITQLSRTSLFRLRTEATRSAETAKTGSGPRDGPRPASSAAANDSPKSPPVREEPE